ncbi:Uncharacterised protein [Gordonia bronchialis]|nr:Uncharacterised protein [Gordonia bronchialis]
MDACRQRRPTELPAVPAALAEGLEGLAGTTLVAADDSRASAQSRVAPLDTLSPATAE